MRTLWEIQGANTVIRSNPRFKRMLAKRPITEQNDLKEITAKLNAARPLVQRIRNSLGGHVETHFLTQAIDNLEWDRFGFFEVGQKIKETHYKFAGELVIEMLLTGVPSGKREAQLGRDMETLAGLLPIVERLEIIIFIYAISRGLV